MRLLIKNIDHLKILPPPDFKIVEVVGRRNLDRARPLLRVGILVRDDRDFAPYQRQDDRFADDVLVALIVRDELRRRCPPAWSRAVWWRL